MPFWQMTDVGTHARAWLLQSLYNSSLVRLVDNIEDADLVYVDWHCHNMWA